jgi:hypothetical protein
MFQQQQTQRKDKIFEQREVHLDRCLPTIAASPT